MSSFKSDKRDFKDRKGIFGAGVSKPVVKIPIPQILLGVKKATEKSNDEEYDLDHFSQYGTGWIDENESVPEDPEIRITSDRFEEYGNKKKDRTSKKTDKKHTDAGDGADFIFKEKDNGDVKSKVSLSHGLQKTSMGGFKGPLAVTSAVFEKTHDKLELFDAATKAEEGSKADSVAIKALDHYRRNLKRDRSRFKEVRLESYKNAKQLKKELKKEKKEAAKKSVDQYFNHSNVHFQSADGRFSSRIDTYFVNSNEKEVIGFQTAVIPVSLKREIQSKNVFESHPQKPSKEGFTDKGTDKTGNGYSYMTEGTTEFRKNEQTQYSSNSWISQSTQSQTKEEQLSHSKAEVKAVKKEERKNLRRAAAAVALSKTLETHKNVSEEFTNEKVTGDLLADGNVGVSKTLSSTIVNITKDSVKKIGSAILKPFKKLAGRILAALAPVFLCLVVVIVVITGASTIFSTMLGDDGEDTESLSYDLNVGHSGTYLSTPYSEAEIDSLIAKLYLKYPTMTSLQESALRIALKAVGGSYDMGSHGTHGDNVWDCSELAYVAWKAAGVDISNGGGYCAADECVAMANQHRTLTGSFTMQPGDLIFWGGKSNGRYKGVYHVAIYLGNIDGVDRMVEAYGKSRGVIVSDIRNQSKIVSISRPV